jgi:adenosylcobinamide kinase/adenosylcobinamide-phosphate guanylyltransferase
MAEKARVELIIGGQKSGKSRLAEQRAADWLAVSPRHRAVLLATGLPWDDEMRQRIARHKADRAERVPGLATVEEPRELAETLQRTGTEHTLVVVDCLTLWLTQALMPPPGMPPVPCARTATENLCRAVSGLPGPVVLVGNEIGLGVIPLGTEVRHFVDELGRLNQAVAAVADRVTLMVAGCPLPVKGGR